MQLVITASKDCYITNKIIDNKYRSKNSNTGRAATLDLFKLFEESGVIESGNFITSNVTEKSALLIKFDYSKIGNLTSSIADIKGSRGFKAYLELKDVSSGLQKPFNFSAICNPLVRDFSEGFGIDVNLFNDLDSANYLTSSFSSATPVLWKSEGASAAGGNDATFAQGSITVSGTAGWDNTVGFTLNDSSNSVSFLANVGSAAAAKTDANNYTFGINGVTTAADIADRIFAAIELSKAEGDLKVTATDPGDTAVVVVRQNVTGLIGNTAITLANEAGRLAAVNFAGGHNTSHLDIITSASFGTTKVDLGSSKYLETPNQDLVFDITNAVSASIKGLIDNNGFRIGFSGSYDTDNKTRFVKRFASRHVKNKLFVPKLRVVFDDSITDDSRRIYLDKAASIFLKTKKGITSSNLFDNSGAQLTGDNCGVLKVVSGSFTQTTNFSQVNRSSDSSRLVGVYEASITLPSNNPYIKKALTADPSGFDVELVWETTDSAIVFERRKARIYNDNHSSFDITSVSISFKNRKSEYSGSEDINLSLTATVSSRDYSASRLRKDPDCFSGDLMYKVTELTSGKTVISHTLSDSTKMSLYGNVFSATIKSGTLDPGYSYKLELFSTIDGETVLFDSSFNFKVV